jgi:mRNA interferase RelE/StbE
MKYQVIIPRSVQKQLDDLPDSVYRRMIERIVALKEDPRPRGCVKLKGYENEYRIRVGDYRVRYEVHDRESVVLLLHCGHRRDIYRDR